MTNSVNHGESKTLSRTAENQDSTVKKEEMEKIGEIQKGGGISEGGSK